jgi:hypothetical protein
MKTTKHSRKKLEKAGPKQCMVGLVFLSGLINATEKAATETTGLRELRDKEDTPKLHVQALHADLQVVSASLPAVSAALVVVHESDEEEMPDVTFRAQLVINKKIKQP